MTDVVARWVGPADAGATSTYKIEYTLNNVDWTTIAANQAATSPYVSPSSTLASNTAYGATSVVLTNGTDFSTSGYAYFDDATIQWTGKSTNTLTGVTWHGGYGTYASGTTVYEAHESATASGITISLNAVLFRITHTNPDALVAQPAYFWYFSPPIAPANCCTVITAINSDIGMEALENVDVAAQLSQDIVFSTIGGLHLDKGQSASKVQATNAFGLAFHACWKTSAREAIDLAEVPYLFTLDNGTSNSLLVNVPIIPDMPWVMLSQIASAT